MPIHGLIPDTPSGSGLPRIGKFHKGLPKEVKTRADGSTYEIVGRDTDYFRVTFTEGYEYLAPLFKQEYGAKPRSLPVKINADTVQECFDFWREEWDGAGTLLHRCDGKQQVVTYNKRTGFFEQNQHLCAAPACKCASVARLELILPEFFELTGVLGTFTLETHSEQDMRTLYARLSSFQAMVGSLRGLPLHLYREKRSTGAPKIEKGQRTGERVKVARAMLDIQIAPDFVKENLIPALASTAFSTISPMFEKPTQHPLLVAAVHQGGSAHLALGSGAKRLALAAPVAPAVAPSPDMTPSPDTPNGETKPSWWNAVIKTAAAGMSDADYADLRKSVKALLKDGQLSFQMSEKEAYDAVIELLFKPAAQALIAAQTETPLDESAVVDEVVIVEEEEENAS
jgi:hypothetical protein